MYVHIQLPYSSESVDCADTWYIAASGISSHSTTAEVVRIVPFGTVTGGPSGAIINQMYNKG